MPKAIRIGLVIAGCIGLLFLIFHITFPWMFNWKETLACLDRNNWAILQTFNLASILMLAAMVFFSFRYPSELAGTSLGHSMLVFFSLFYAIRIAAEFAFFGYTGIGSVVIIGLCLAPAVAYLFVAIPSRPID
ncbi:MAG: hypothetical protein JXB07_03425 [Anaerolineae bacterium]|nr:hypothetical protein [Anaerolineae bacterium]